MDRDGLGDFLRRHRAALQPDDVGLSAGSRRRAPGLRREEVAALAHMSSDFYARIEQGRGSRPSEQSAAALARALRLTSDERAHLFELAGHSAPPRAYRTDDPSAGQLRVLDRLDTPAQIVSDLGVTLAQNPLAQALVGVQTNYTGLRRSIIYRWFTDPEQRRIHPIADHPQHSRSHVAALRTARPIGNGSGSAPSGRATVARERRVRSSVGAPRSIQPSRHPEALHPPTLTLDCQVFTSENREALVIFTAAPGSEDADQLALLSVVGSQAFSRPDAIHPD